MSDKGYGLSAAKARPRHMTDYMSRMGNHRVRWTARAARLARIAQEAADAAINLEARFPVSKIQLLAIETVNGRAVARFFVSAPNALRTETVPLTVAVEASEGDPGLQHVAAFLDQIATGAPSPKTGPRSKRSTSRRRAPRIERGVARAK